MLELKRSELETEGERREAKDVPSKPPALAFAQENAVFAAVIAAVTAGVGWAVKYATDLSLGVGPLWAGREAAVGTGIAFFVLVAPYFLLSFLYGLGHVRSRRRLGWCLVAQFVYTFLVISCLLAPGARLGYGGLYFWFALASLGLVGITGLMLLLIRWLQRSFNTPVEEKVARNAHWFSLVALPALMQICASTIIPYTSPIFGGYELSPVEVVSETPGLSGKRLIVTSDVNWTVLAAYATPDEFWAAYQNQKKKPLLLARVRSEKFTFRTGTWR